MLQVSVPNCCRWHNLKTWKTISSKLFRINANCTSMFTTIKKSLFYYNLSKDCFDRYRWWIMFTLSTIVDSIVSSFFTLYTHAQNADNWMSQKNKFLTLLMNPCCNSHSGQKTTMKRSWNSNSTLSNKNPSRGGPSR